MTVILLAVYTGTQKVPFAFFIRERAGEYVVIVGIATGGDRQGLRFDDLGQAFVVLHEFGGGESGSVHALDEFTPSDHLGELGQQGGTGAERDGALAGQVEQAPWRALPEQTR
jgi:hypothetical protein